jgi:hypothetical protein
MQKILTIAEYVGGCQRPLQPNHQHGSYTMLFDPIYLNLRTPLSVLLLLLLLLLHPKSFALIWAYLEEILFGNNWPQFLSYKAEKLNRALSSDLTAS